MIVGAMKAGTTSLAAWLRAHPQVFMSDDKELHFFDHRWELGIDWYCSHFAGAPDGAAVGEASPSYCVRQAYVERIAAVVPEARLIMLLRDPVERAWSQHRYSLRRGDTIATFEQAIDGELALGPDDWRTAGMCLARGRYIEHLASLTSRFGRDRLHVVLFDDLADDPRALFASTCRFLGIDDGVVPDEVGRPFDPADALPPHADVEMSPDTRRWLVEYFRPYNQRLADWLDADLSAWDRLITAAARRARRRCAAGPGDVAEAAGRGLVPDHQQVEPP